jgi:hypothetical protein
MTDMATGSDVTPKGFHWKGARMRNRKLRNIRPSSAFWPEMTSSNVTRRASPGKYASVHACSEVPLGYSLGRPCLIIVF